MKKLIIILTLILVILTIITVTQAQRTVPPCPVIDCVPQPVECFKEQSVLEIQGDIVYACYTSVRKYQV